MLTIGIVEVDVYGDEKTSFNKVASYYERRNEQRKQERNKRREELMKEQQENEAQALAELKQMAKSSRY